MFDLIGFGEMETPDRNLCSALRLAIVPFPAHERARCRAAPFEEFDAAKELNGSPVEIATRWLDQAGYD